MSGAKGTDAYGGLRASGSRATERIEMAAEIRSCAPFARRVKARLLTREEFIERHASGTLRKNNRIGMRMRDQYLHERTVFEFGWGFECVPETRVTWGSCLSEPDCRPITELGWLVDRYATVCAFPGDEMELKYIAVEYPDGARREGLGLVIRKTSADFIPEGHMVFALITEHDPVAKDWKEAVNPC